MSTVTINYFHDKNNTCFLPNYFAESNNNNVKKVKNSGHEKEAILP